MKKTKKCLICGELLTGRRRRYCSKVCYEKAQKEYKKIYRENHKEEMKEYKKIYYKDHKEEINEKGKIYNKENKEARKKYIKIYYKDHKEEIKERSRIYGKNNKEKIKEYKKKNIKRINYCRKQRAKNPMSKLHTNISRSIRQNLKSNNLSKNRRKWENLLGYTTQDLKEHLEKLFLPGMSWKNYGRNGWHIDHIIPIVFFRFKNINDVEFRYCWSLNNLQPLWGKDNDEKSDKIILWGKEINAKNIDSDYFLKIKY